MNETRIWPIRNSEGDTYITEHELKEHDELYQLWVMRSWFINTYDNPFEEGRLSEENATIFFYGGPYEPLHELLLQFGDVVPNEVIRKLAEELSEESSDWDGKPSDYYDEFDNFLLENMGKTTEFLDDFQHKLTDITGLLYTKVDVMWQLAFHRMLYANLITAMETYLSDAFITVVLSDKKYIRNFVETSPEFQKRTIKQSSLFEQIETIEEQVKRELLQVMWHNLPKVLGMFKETFGIETDKDEAGKTRKANLIAAVKNRHDIVHRYGKSAEGEEFVIHATAVNQLLLEVKSLVRDIDQQLEPHTAGLHKLSFLGGQKQVQLQ